MAPAPKARTRRRRPPDTPGVEDEGVAAEPKRRPRARPKAKAEPQPPEAEASQPASSSTAPAVEPTEEPPPRTPPRRPRATASTAPVEVVQPAAEDTATDPAALAREATPATTGSGLTAADTTEDTGRINAWFRMQNPAFYNTKVYDPLADLNQANKLDRYMARNTFIF